MEGITIEVEGAEQILDALSALETRNILNIIKSIERKDLTENVIKPLRSISPYSSTTNKNIRVVADKEDKTGFFAGPTSDSFWIRFVEKGTDVRTTKKGLNKGKITAHPIFTNLIENQVDAVIDYFNKDFGTAVNEILEKKIKKLKK